MGYIYMIRNKINNKAYIGQTKRTILKRYAGHLKSATMATESNKEYNLPLYTDMREYGIENFEVIKLIECDNDDLNDYEVKFIQEYNTYLNGYNNCRGGSGNVKLKDKELVELWNKGYNIQEIAKIANIKYIWSIKNKLLKQGIAREELDERIIQHRDELKGKKTYQYTLDGKYVNEYISIQEACKALGVNYNIGTIYNVMAGIKYTAYGYLWRNYKVDQLIDIPEYVKKAYSKNKPKNNTKINLNDSKNKKVYQYDLNGNFIREFNSIMQASLSIPNNKYARTGVGACANGKLQMSYGYIWKFYKVDKLDVLPNIKTKNQYTRVYWNEREVK